MSAKPSMWWPGINHQHSLARGLLAAWLFWERGGIRVRNVRGTGHDAILTNMDPATDWVVTPWGLGLQKDNGDDALVVDDFPTAVWGNKVTVACRVKADVEDFFGQHIISFHPGWFLTGVADTDIWRFAVIADNEGSAEIDSLANMGTAWHHVAGVYDGAQVRTYLEGRPTGNTAAATGNIGTTGSLRLGTHWNSSGAHEWAGQFDYVYIWNRVLTDSEISELAVDPYGLVRPRRRVFSVTAAPPSFIPYPRPRGARAGMAELVGGMH